MSQVGEPLDELPLPPYVTAEDVDFAVRAIAVHAPEQWPTGPLCRNDHAPHPCRLHRWGQRVLAQRGLTATEITALVAHYRATAVRR
ncbi:hypothetical protein [Plantactinospora endophytica]|uniref:Uncharacterized protein n=1 Tax=Plantactinospora endophytica TaxID=673535 RepID=A0ABQ4DSQ4_9ACTN|nr:hypothetical protein [Plantactinospora endophytica]GIG85482.1 hypothetical protein Pen02_04180 [Plantactinospora endophytica]